MARKKYVIKVTQRHIDSGYMGSTNSCPLARGLHAAGLRRWNVGCDSAGTQNKDVNLPPSAAKFRADFDNGVKVRPFQFEIWV